MDHDSQAILEKGRTGKVQGEDCGWKKELRKGSRIAGEAQKEKFLRMIRRGKPRDCWPWTMAKDKNGYGKFGERGRAHRIMWSISRNQEIPNGMFVIHKCDNPTCCNPSHLLIGTPLDNMLDKCRKGRQSRGEKHGKIMRGVLPRGDKHRLRINPELAARGEVNGSAKLKTEIVNEIRAIYASGKFTQRDIARRFGIGFSQTNRIVRGISWAHLIKPNNTATT